MTERIVSWFRWGILGCADGLVFLLAGTCEGIVARRLCCIFCSRHGRVRWQTSNQRISDLAQQIRVLFCQKLGCMFFVSNTFVIVLLDLLALFFFAVYYRVTTYGQFYPKSSLKKIWCLAPCFFFTPLLQAVRKKQRLVQGM